MTLTEGQWALDGLVFGRGTDFNVARFEIGSPDARQNDAPNVREDGERFGRDYRAGRTITFDMNVLGRDYAVLDRLAVLESAWDAPSVRLTPGGTSVLQYCRGGKTRRTYGRARRFAPATGLDWAGNVPVVADFRTVDHRFYDNNEGADTFGLVPDTVGGLVGPLIGPVIASGAGSGVRGIVVDGTDAAWLTYRIYGPIRTPTVTVTGQWSATFNTTLASDQSMLVSPVPWSRSIRRNDGANLGGTLTARSRRISGMRVRPGNAEIALTGTDASATARMSVYWRPSWASY